MNRAEQMRARSASLPQTRMEDNRKLIAHHVRDRQTGQAVETTQSDMFREELEESANAVRGQAVMEVRAVRALAVVEAATESSRQNGQMVEIRPLITEARR